MTCTRTSAGLARWLRPGLFGAAGFEPVEIIRPGRSGHLVRAHRP
jgi:hypothetical protein